MAEYGEWVDADADVTFMATTVNRTVNDAITDAFDVIRIKAVDDDTVTVELRNIHTRALFQATWTFIEDEEKTNGE